MVKYDYKKIVECILLITLCMGIYFAKYFNNIRHNGEVSRARQTLYEVTNIDREDINYDYVLEDKKVDKEKLQFYEFKVSKTNGEDFDFRYLVRKDDFNVYVYDKKGFVVPYEDHVNSDSILGNYFYEIKNMKYEDIPPATRDFFEENGGIMFLKKVEESINISNESVIEEYGGMIKYIDLVMNGVNISTLLDN